MVEERGLDFAGTLQLDLSVLAPERAVLRIQAQDVLPPTLEGGAASVSFYDLVGIRPDHAALAGAFGEFVPPVLGRCEVCRKDDRLEEAKARDVLGVHRRKVRGRRAAGRVTDDRRAAQAERIAEAPEVCDEVPPVVWVYTVIWISLSCSWLRLVAVTVPSHVEGIDIEARRERLGNGVPEAREEAGRV